MTHSTASGLICALVFSGIAITACGLEPVRLSPEGTGFVMEASGRPFVPWGFNFVGEHHTVLEEYWAEDWASTEEDFANMKKLGANVVRVHLQLGTYMKSPTQVRPEELQRLQRLLDLAERNDLYLDLTGLGCYHREHIPEWLDELPESERWEVQARFWEAIARVCAGHPAVFCYDLMNEPVIGGPSGDDLPWLGKPLEDFHFVQKIVKNPGDRDRKAIAQAWVEKMTQAIRKVDDRGLITVGVIPWALVWPNAKPVFYSPEVAEHLDFVSVHFYPESGKISEAVEALKVYDIGKPLVVEEIFPMRCSVDELDRFIEECRNTVDGWIAHYFGVMPGTAEPDSITEAAQVKGVEYWRDKAVSIRKP